MQKTKKVGYGVCTRLTRFDNMDKEDQTHVI